MQGVAVATCVLVVGSDFKPREVHGLCDLCDLLRFYLLILEFLLLFNLLFVPANLCACSLLRFRDSHLAFIESKLANVQNLNFHFIVL